MSHHDLMNPGAASWPERLNTYTYNLRRTYRSYYAAGAAVNHATHTLYNSSTGAVLLLVHSFSFAGFSAAGIHLLRVQPGTLGTHLGGESPLWPAVGRPAGQHNWSDEAAAVTPDFFQVAGAAANYLGIGASPVAIVPPNWCFIFQDNGLGATTTGAFVWEELLPDDPVMGLINTR